METIRAQLRDLIAVRFERSIHVPEAFFAAHAATISQACWAMARRFHQGGRIIAFGNGACATDAHHVAVEFVHPVIVGKRALPAIALTNDGPFISGSFHTNDKSGADFASQLKLLARPSDMALGFSSDGKCQNVATALTKAKTIGLLTIGFAGEDGGNMRAANLDYCFTVPADDPLVVQETHETLYHILWELVHVFFEHEGLLK